MLPDQRAAEIIADYIASLCQVKSEQRRSAWMPDAHQIIRTLRKKGIEIIDPRASEQPDAGVMPYISTDQEGTENA